VGYYYLPLRKCFSLTGGVTEADVGFPTERSLLLSDHFSLQNGLALKMGDYCIYRYYLAVWNNTVLIKFLTIFFQMPNIKLQSSDGEIFEIEVEIARQSVTIKTMLEGKCYKANKFTTTCAISAYHH
jgi:hypothetical protein